VLVVADDGSVDGTADLAARALSGSGLAGSVLPTTAARVGEARAAGVRHVAVSGAEPTRTWVLSTDADCVVPAGWVRSHLEHAERGAVAVAGVVTLVADRDSETIRGAWERDYRPAIRVDGTHSYVHAANLGVRLDAYLASGGFPHVAREEDVGLWRRLRRAGYVPVSDAGIVVATSARPDGRVREGFAHALNHLYGRTAAPLAGAAP
jgi:hypothetical protein